MRITSPPEAIRLRHSVCFYDSEPELMGQLVSVAAAAVDAGEPLALALRPTTERALRAAVDFPTDVLGLARPDGPDGPSGQTLAARWARELRELTASGRRHVTVVAEHWGAFDGADGGFWTELDAAANIALSDLPVSMTCFYPAFPLHGSVLDGALRNHRAVLRKGLLRANDAYLAPLDVLLSTPAPAPLVLGPPDQRRSFGAWALNEVRDTVESAMLVSGFGRDRAEDVVLAVNEIATNAVEHGTGDAELLLWTDADGFVVEVNDRGVLRNPLPGLVAPHPAEPRGRGVWIARQLCDSLHVWSDGDGTHVRLRAAP
ncbi:MAG: ATP-binding protein [Pseudonocardiales bacterium]|nr:ATP-binding protein [Pseudonocardiales bacterium]